MSNYEIKEELNAVNDAVRDNDDAKVITEGDVIAVVKKEEVAPDFTVYAAVDVVTGATDFGSDNTGT